MENRLPSYTVRTEKKVVAFSKGLKMFFLCIIFYIAILVNFYLLEISMTTTITMLVAVILFVLVIFEVLMGYVKENTEINFYEDGISKLTNKGESFVGFSKAKQIKLKRSFTDLIFGAGHVRIGKASFGPFKNYKDVFNYAKQLFDYYQNYNNQNTYQQQNQNYNSEVNNYGTK